MEVLNMEQLISHKKSCLLISMHHLMSKDPPFKEENKALQGYHKAGIL